MVVVLALGVLALLAVGLRLVVGSGFSWGWPASEAILQIRMTRAASGVVVGSALAVSGVFLQTLLRNPLASPDLLGVSSGAGLGVMIAALAAFAAGHGIAPTGADGAAALTGGLAALALVYSLGQRRWALEPVTLILVGVVISILCGAGIQLVRHLMPDQGVAAGRLLLGSIRDDASPVMLGVVAVLVVGSVVAGTAAGRWLDASALSEDEARAVGVPLGALRLGMFVLAGTLAAGSVTLAGAIGFVGLVCPHLVRLLAGPAHRALVPGAAFAGAAVVVGADVLVRLIELPTGRLPIGVLTALIGGPALIVLLRAERRGRLTA